MATGVVPSATPAEPQPAPRPAVHLWVARGLLVLLALVLPFEAPLFRLGPLQITTVELVLYATLAAWGLVTALDIIRSRSLLRTADGLLRGDAMVHAAVMWSAVLLASAAYSPSHRAAAFKFVLRSFSGVLVFFAARALARPPEITRRVVRALVVGALLSAATAVVQTLMPNTLLPWRFFRAGDFDAFGLARASGVFAYPTIGAMYWEAALPLLSVAPFLGARRRELAAPYSTARIVESMRQVGLAVLGSALLSWAILASGTRSGLAGAAIACATLLWLVWRSGISVRRTALGVLLTSSTLALVIMSSGTLLAQRLRWWHDDRWFGAEYVVGKAPRTVRAGELFSVPVTLRNTGTLAWPRTGVNPTHLSYHWERLDGPTTLADFEGYRTELPADVPPGGMLDVVAIARGPDADGAYLLRWDLVQERVTWFSDRGSAMPKEHVDVNSSANMPPASAIAAALVVPFEPPPPKRLALWRAAVVLWREHPLLGIGPDNFRRRYQAVLSPAPTGQPYTDVRVHANSLYFETLADLGLAGAAALVLLALALLRLLREHYASGCLAGLGCGVAAAAFFIHGTFDYFFEFTPLFGLFWLLLGLTAEKAAVRSTRHHR